MFDIQNRRYIGSKYKLVKNIIDIIEEYQYDSFLDLFGGTGIVASGVKDAFKTVGVNDILYSNLVIYEAFFGKGTFSMDKLQKLCLEFNKLSGKKTFFSNIYANTYFSEEDCKKIGSIRERIDTVDATKREKYILLASLLYSADRVSNTVGHYEAYLKKNKDFKKFEFNLINPYNDSFNIYNEDANDLVKRVSYDVVYIDPPYNSRQYSRFYHILETIVLWKKFDPMGEAKKPPLDKMSLYCTSKAKNVFKNLIENIDAKLIIVSYNNTYNPNSNSSKNKISKADIEEILSKKGKLMIKELNHPYFNAGKTSFNNHKEYLYICEIK